MSQESSGTKLEDTELQSPFDNPLREVNDRIVSPVVAASRFSVRQGGLVVAANGRCSGVDSPRYQRTMSSRTLGEDTTRSSP